MIRSCPTCGDYDDEFRTTVCPHRAFASNDGNNAFEVRHDSVGPAPAPGTFDPCPKCGSPLIVGFGLTGEGFEAYSYCGKEGCNHFDKFEDTT